jgi:uncharacterized protein YeaO (DUF488 family)
MLRSATRAAPQASDRARRGLRGRRIFSRANRGAQVPILTRRWNDPPDPGEKHALRVLVTRYRPRGVSKAAETWDKWWPDLGPSRALHAAFWGKSGPPLTFPEYRTRYLEEMQRQVFRIRALGDRVAAGETVALLCSSACTDPGRCHRTLLASLVQAAARRK